MVKLTVILGVLFALITMLSRPYMAPIGYQTISYMQAHAIWFWAFDGMPVFRIFALISITSWFIAAIRKKVDFSVYKYKQNALLLVFLAILYLSDWASPYPSYATGLSTKIVQSTVFTILFMYFISAGLCANRMALKLQVAIIIATTLYFTYWANSAYIESQWDLFYQGRLNGLANSQYKDGNLMSIIYVMGMPFCMFLYKYIPHKTYKYIPLLALPFLWHAVFLHSSRGAFLSLAASTLYAAYLMRARLINIGLVAGLIGALLTQGGELLSRSEETVAGDSDVYGVTKPINPRLVSWQVGLDIALEYPLLGAGTQRFLTASEHLFPGKSPHVAHNTFLSYAANLGFPATIIHLLILVIAFKYRANLIRAGVADDPLHAYIADASTVALLGYIICSMFLDLTLFEPFYFMLSVMLVNQHVYFKRISEAISGEADERLRAEG